MIQMNILNKHTFQTFAQSLNAKTRYFLTTCIYLLLHTTWIKHTASTSGLPLMVTASHFSTFHFLHLVDLRCFAALDR